MNDLDKMAHEIAQAHERFGDWGYEDMVDAIRAALLTAPPGYVLVPEEPTGDQLMWMGGHDEASQQRAYAGLLDAAPEPK